MIMMRKALVTAGILPVVALAGCSGDTKSEPAASPSPTTRVNDASDDPGETGGGVRIPLGQTKVVPVPADAVLDIKGEQDWDKSVLQCTATSATGEAIELLPPPSDAQPEEAAHGGVWMPMWTVAAAPGEVTIGCADPDKRIPHSDTSFVRVVPRGLPFR
ncbi:hypothetical protein [Nocardia crassostreae]|uniref:hypothetical protein n=1 Tax=Nocardia crassostreae TaxID=53428 RepID=UPI000829C900|nr:hypothetical protein [Nocardia crassostreae]